jgi:hypothetical protein
MRHYKVVIEVKRRKNHLIMYNNNKDKYNIDHQIKLSNKIKLHYHQLDKIYLLLKKLINTNHIYINKIIENYLNLLQVNNSFLILFDVNHVIVVKHSR